jgi:hypothetical protein
MTITEGTILTLATASLLTTAATLHDARRRRTRRSESGRNGVYLAIADRNANREWMRLAKHVIAVFGVAVVACPVPVAIDPVALRTALFGVICVLLAFNSVRDLRHYRWVESMQTEREHL